MVEAMNAYGIGQEEIAKCLGIDPKTLRKHYREELDTATAKAVAAVGGKLYRKAMNGCTTSMIFFLKTRGKWNTKLEVENSGVVGNLNMNAAPAPEQKEFTDPMEAAKFYKQIAKDC